MDLGRTAREAHPERAGQRVRQGAHDPGGEPRDERVLRACEARRQELREIGTVSSEDPVEKHGDRTGIEEKRSSPTAGRNGEVRCLDGTGEASDELRYWNGPGIRERDRHVSSR